MTLKTRKQIDNIAEKLGWECTFDGRGCNKMVRFSTDSPAQQDVFFELYNERLSDIPKLVFDYWQDYDPSYEASLWLDDDGHGKNGAPYEMGDVYDDMVAAQSAMQELYEALAAKKTMGVL